MKIEQTQAKAKLLKSIFDIPGAVEVFPELLNIRLALEKLKQDENLKRLKCQCS